MAELPRQSSNPMAVTLAEGGSVTLIKDHDDVLIAVDLGDCRGGAMVRVPLPIAAYLAGGLAHMAGVQHG